KEHPLCKEASSSFADLRRHPAQLERIFGHVDKLNPALVRYRKTFVLRACIPAGVRYEHQAFFGHDVERLVNTVLVLGEVCQRSSEVHSSELLRRAQLGNVEQRGVQRSAFIAPLEAQRVEAISARLHMIQPTGDLELSELARSCGIAQVEGEE